MVTVLPETVYIVSLLSNVTGNPELDSAVTVNGALARFIPDIGWKQFPEAPQIKQLHAYE